MFETASRCVVLMVADHTLAEIPTMSSTGAGSQER